MSSRPVASSVLLLLLAVPALAAVPPDVRCGVAKLNAAGRRERRMALCHASAASHGTAVAPECLAAAADGLAGDFARAESHGGCATTGDAATLAADVTQTVALVASRLRPTSAASTCAARKLRAAAKAARTIARDFAQYQVDHDGAALDQAGFETVQRVSATFAGLEAAGGCLTTGDAQPVTNLLVAGTEFLPPIVPGGVFLFVARLFPVCGDQARGGSEMCDGFDVGVCLGPCRPDCTCPVCGDGIRNQTTEVCDGADDAACHGLCQPDCTCPPPVCGNGVKESGEACDGADLGACGSSCEPDCTCGPAVCGNGIIEQGEECEGTICTFEGILASCTPPSPGGGGCQCCDGGVCQVLGCCDSADTCLPSPGIFGVCFPLRCRPDHPCLSGYTCIPISADPPNGICAGDVGSVCAYFGPLAPCVPPAVCPGGSLAYCCLPAGEACTGASDCCSGSCSGGTCG